MANSKYEYVKNYEPDDKLRLLFLNNWIIVRINGYNFHKFSSTQEFEKPNDGNALNLMNFCARSTLEQFPDIVFAYGGSDEFSFVLDKRTKFYQRRHSKILSLFESYFTALYVINWKLFFPNKELKEIPSFIGRFVLCSEAETVRDYLAWRQADCHENNQYNTCYWMLIKSGKTEKEAELCLKGTQSKDKNEILFQQFGINYDKIPEMFKKGSCVYRNKVEEIVKTDKNGNPIKRKRNKVTLEHVDIIGPRFWEQNPYIFRSEFKSSANSCDYVKSYELDDRLSPSNWVVVRIDGCHFHKFSSVHEFEKPNDANALNLMNFCAKSMLEQFPDIVFAYGVSDEYSFVLHEKTHFYQRSHSKILSLLVSYFTAVYVINWNKFFPSKELKEIPYFDGRIVLYPKAKIIRDYLAWRQVDCHINNQYNTCFWASVKSGKSKQEAQECLKGTLSKDKNEILLQQFGINYDELPEMFKKGSCVYRNEVEEMLNIVTVEHIDIIGPKFWEEHPYILYEE